MKEKGTETPPAVYRPLIGEDGNGQIKDVILQFVLGVMSALPESVLPEFAFVRKPNVGESSLLNVFVNRKAPVCTSTQLGKTQTINFYRVNGAVYFVDLPGYGYANASEAVGANWGKMIGRYLHEDKQLHVVFLLLDLHHAPLKNDVLMYNWIIDQGLPAVLVGAKVDKLKRSQLEKQKKLLRKTLGAPKETPLVLFSSVTKQRREEPLCLVAETVKQALVRLQ